MIDSWSSALREGDLERAAGYFRVPSVVQNGTPPVKLDSERKVVLFNASLPCGAELTKTEQRDDYVIATFELTERPGAGECGSGVGIEARTAFRIEDGLIVEWRRVADAPGSDALARPSGRLRDEAARRRDETASERDRTAEERDHAAEELDHEAERLARELDQTDDRTAAALEAAAISRGRAAGVRGRAAADRERAALDREAAARDREQHERELEHAELDELTGAYRRGLGAVALGNEIERANRSGKGLVLAYVDVDSLKLVSDRHGHAAGDALLRDVVAALRSKLRPYDPLVRLGPASLSSAAWPGLVRSRRR